MTANLSEDADCKSTSSSDTVAILETFLAENSGAQAAAKSLRPGAEVAITLADVAGDWRIFASAAGHLALERAKAMDPDFELHIPRGAAQTLCTNSLIEVGELGIAFFELIGAHEQELKIHLKVRSGLIKLTRRGWLGVISQGGPKVMMWLARKGFHGPGAITAALRKLSG